MLVYPWCVDSNALPGPPPSNAVAGACLNSGRMLLAHDAISVVKATANRIPSMR